MVLNQDIFSYLIGTFCIVNSLLNMHIFMCLIFNRNILYCKQQPHSLFNLSVKDLIGTFCIVNRYFQSIKNLNFLFNRNILYCKSIFSKYKELKFSHLIGTFCIVNYSTKLHPPFLLYLIGTFCIVNVIQLIKCTFHKCI